MNWKIVATLIVGSSLLAACGGSNQAPVMQGDTRTNGTDAPGGGAMPAKQDPTIAPAAAPTQEAKKPIVIHE